MKVTFQGNPLTVKGNQVKIGDKAPEFKAVNRDLSDFDFKNDGNVKVISVVPSLDTPVCSLQTMKFNMELEKLENVDIITVSVDLPFAQDRFCVTEDIEKITVISDYKYKDFSEKYGCMIEELEILTRAVFVVDRDGTIKHVEYLEEITNEPSYEKAIEVVNSL